MCCGVISIYFNSKLMLSGHKLVSEVIIVLDELLHLVVVFGQESTFNWAWSVPLKGEEGRGK